MQAFPPLKNSQSTSVLTYQSQKTLTLPTKQFVTLKQLDTWQLNMCTGYDLREEETRTLLSSSDSSSDSSDGLKLGEGGCEH